MYIGHRKFTTPTVLCTSSIVIALGFSKTNAIADMYLYMQCNVQGETCI